MCKKVGIAVGAVVLGLAALFFFKPHSKIASLIGWGWEQVGQGIDGAVPLDVEIDRINHEVNHLSDDIKANFSKVAQEEVAVSKLKKEIDKSKAALAHDEELIVTMKKDLDAGTKTIVYGDREYSREKVAAQLAQAWDAFKVAETTLKTKEKILEQKQSQVDAANAKIREMVALQEQLKTEVARLKAELEAAQLAQVKAEVQVDDTRLANIKSSMQAVQDKIDEMNAVAAKQGEMPLSIPVDRKVKTANAMDEINQRFADKLASERK